MPVGWRSLKRPSTFRSDRSIKRRSGPPSFTSRRPNKEPNRFCTIDGKRISHVRKTKKRSASLLSARCRNVSPAAWITDDKDRGTDFQAPVTGEKDLVQEQAQRIKYFQADEASHVDQASAAAKKPRPRLSARRGEECSVDQPEEEPEFEGNHGVACSILSVDEPEGDS